MLCTLFCDVIVIMKLLMTKYYGKVSQSQGLVCIDYSRDPAILQLRMKKNVHILCLHKDFMNFIYTKRNENFYY